MKCVLMSSTNVQTQRTEEEEEVRVRGVKGDTSITRAVITIIVLCVKSWSCVCHGSWSWVTYPSTVLGTWAEERTQFRLVSDIIALHSSIMCCNCNWVIRNPETAEQGGDRGQPHSGVAVVTTLSMIRTRDTSTEDHHSSSQLWRSICDQRRSPSLLRGMSHLFMNTIRRFSMTSIIYRQLTTRENDNPLDWIPDLPIW